MYITVYIYIIISYICIYLYIIHGFRANDHKSRTKTALAKNTHIYYMIWMNYIIESPYSSIHPTSNIKVLQTPFQDSRCFGTRTR